MKVLYVCTELFPFLKTGGLADVGAGLAPALQAVGCELRLLMPSFPAFAGKTSSRRPVASLPHGKTPWGASPELPRAEVVLATLADFAAPLYLLQCASLYERQGNPYLGPDGKPWLDNAQRFAALGWAAATLGQGLDPDWIPDVIHCHDWHAGLAPAYVRAFAQVGQSTPATVFTIHNLAYQGLFPGHVFAQLGLPASAFDLDGLEYFGQVSFMKSALQYADRITTVSPTYAREIRTPAQGCGLDGLLCERANALTGILNGVDYAIWNPASDALLAKTYDMASLADKSINKRALQKKFALEPRANALVFGVVSRLIEQKGLHWLPEVMAELVQRGGQLVVLGQGESALEQAFVDATIQYPGQVGLHVGYDEADAHAVIAGSDVILVPSVFEPCGLTQLYGLRYGSLPLVRRVGGLADTVTDCSLENIDDGSATGFVFDDASASGLRSAMRRAFALYRRRDEWTAVQRQAMALRFDWLAAAQHYQALYQSLRSGQARRVSAVSGTI